MANKDHPRGFEAVGTLSGGKIPLRQYVAASTIYKGDPVAVNAAGKVARVTTVTGTDYIVGVAAHYAAASEGVAVYDCRDVIFKINSDGTTDPGATTAQGHIGSACRWVAGSANTTTKLSGHELDYSAITSTAGVEPLIIVGLDSTADNDTSLSHADYLVMITRHIWQPRAQGWNTTDQWPAI